jgi:hypothetical protein
MFFFKMERLSLHALTGQFVGQTAFNAEPDVSKIGRHAECPVSGTPSWCMGDWDGRKAAWR